MYANSFFAMLCARHGLRTAAASAVGDLFAPIAHSSQEGCPPVSSDIQFVTRRTLVSFHVGQNNTEENTCDGEDDVGLADITSLKAHDDA